MSFHDSSFLDSSSPPLTGHGIVERINDHADTSLQASGDTQLAEVYEDSKGKKRVKGTRALKGSQAYPPKCFDGRQQFVCL